MRENKLWPTITEDNKNFHLNQLNIDLGSMDKLVSFTRRKATNETHLEFVENYKKTIEQHKINISQSFETLKNISSDLTVFINNNINSIFDKEGFSLGGRTFYFSYYRGSYTFFTPLFKDDYYDKYAYGLITYNYRNNNFKLDEIAIGFNNNPVDVLSDCPRDLLQKINSMDSANSIEEILNTFSECENDIKKLFFVSDLNQIIDYKDESFKIFFGLEPINVVQKNNVKKDENIIRFQLKQHVDNLSSELIELIKTEHTCLRLKQDKFDDLLEVFIPKKETLLKQNNINQKELDKLMSFINLDYLD